MQRGPRTADLLQKELRAEVLRPARSLGLNKQDLLREQICQMKVIVGATAQPLRNYIKLQRHPHCGNGVQLNLHDTRCAMSRRQHARYRSSNPHQYGGSVLPVRRKTSGSTIVELRAYLHPNYVWHIDDPRNADHSVSDTSEICKNASSSALLKLHQDMLHIT